MTAIVVVFLGIFNRERLLCWAGGALLVGDDPVQAAGDPGIDPRVSLVSRLSSSHHGHLTYLVSTARAPADHAYDGVGPGALLGHQRAATISLTRVFAALTWTICNMSRQAKI